MPNGGTQITAVTAIDTVINTRRDPCTHTGLTLLSGFLVPFTFSTAAGLVEANPDGPCVAAASLPLPPAIVAASGGLTLDSVAVAASTAEEPTPTTALPVLCVPPDVRGSLPLIVWLRTSSAIGGWMPLSVSSPLGKGDFPLAFSLPDFPLSALLPV
ncbi:hypothetical protein DQ04_03421000 [Trypanosoma grayi]|uniref:hypothetical protein n=1 Tax=Trypanosoma grayi TaxID=71804 RepID=UPI0004F474A7|nr:hypothetical protein DQ04_03421000 [Trypanosoma grayi]KEG10674.1 hypothetical protein DQ04_03421000 [Trypanosoma grayi]